MKSVLNWTWKRWQGWGEADVQQQVAVCWTAVVDVSAHLHQNLLKTKADIEKYTDETLAQQKDKASDVGLLLKIFCPQFMHKVM